MRLQESLIRDCDLWQFLCAPWAEATCSSLCCPPSFLCNHPTFKNENSTSIFFFICLGIHGSCTVSSGLMSFGHSGDKLSWGRVAGRSLATRQLHLYANYAGTAFPKKHMHGLHQQALGGFMKTAWIQHKEVKFTFQPSLLRLQPSS